MNKRLVALSLVLSLAAGAAIAADAQHYGTAPTKKDAKRLATDQAKASAKDLAQCYHPARQVDDCQTVEGGFRCRAETSARYSSCKRAGWVNAYTASSSPPVSYVGWRGAVAKPWPLDTSWGPVVPRAYGEYLPREVTPTPFPN